MNNIQLNSNQAWFFLPAAVVGATCFAARISAGGVGVCAKGASHLANAIGKDVLSQNLNATSKKLISFATKNPKKELGLFCSLIILGAAGAYGISKIGSAEEIVKPIIKPIEVKPDTSSWGYMPFLALVPAGLIGIGVLQTPQPSQEDNLDKTKLSNDDSNDSPINLDYSKGTYQGFLHNGLPHGQGTFTAADGTMYVGEFDLGKFKGGQIIPSKQPKMEEKEEIWKSMKKYL